MSGGSSIGRIGGGNSASGYFPRNRSHKAPKCRTFHPSILEKRQPNEVSMTGGFPRSIEEDERGRASTCSGDGFMISVGPACLILVPELYSMKSLCVQFSSYKLLVV